MGSLHFIISGAASAAVSVLHNETALPMTTVMAGCSVLTFLILHFGAKSKPEHKPKKAAEKEEKVQKPVPVS
jgi:DHA1 family bicyclomycin/chloramphenicol resistance-like MFS transporter